MLSDKRFDNYFENSKWSVYLLFKVSMWVQLQIPKIEDGNNFGVAVQVSLALGLPKLDGATSK